MNRILCLTFVFLACTLRAAETSPSWPELAGLFGQSVDSPALQKFAAQYALKKIAKGDSGSFTPHDQSYSVMFGSNRIDCIVLHIGPPPKGYGEPHWAGYTGDLPFKLKRLYTRKDVTEAIGEPDTSGGSFWQVDGYEMRVSFLPSTGLIQEIYIWNKAKAASKDKADSKKAK